MESAVPPVTNRREARPRWELARAPRLGAHAVPHCRHHDEQLFHDRPRGNASPRTTSDGKVVLMTSFTGPDEPGSFDEFLARYLGSASGTGGPRGPARRVDFNRLMSAGARELVMAAAQEAMDRGETDLDTQHLLLASTAIDATRRWLGRAGVDPDSVARLLD
jgi:hypothetical protein